MDSSAQPSHSVSEPHDQGSDRLPLSICIPTLGREHVLLDTLRQLLDQKPAAGQILVIDQTPEHEASTTSQLQQWDAEGRIHWHYREAASQPGALNEGLERATEPFVLFLDDDIRIDPGFLQAHIETFEDENIWAVAGQVLQPGEEEDPDYVHQRTGTSLDDVNFSFRSSRVVDVCNGMSGNLCVRRNRAIEIGGFDENFLPPVAYRFDNEFCVRLCRGGGRIVFQPRGRIYHLRAMRGGTRSQSNHLTSMSPEHGVGDYYFAMCCGRGLERIRYIVRRPFREICTRFHLRHPWYIPVKFIGEIRALLLAERLYVRKKRAGGDLGHTEPVDEDRRPE